jgi:hypothetical protein
MDTSEIDELVTQGRAIWIVSMQSTGSYPVPTNPQDWVAAGACGHYLLTKCRSTKPQSK